VVADAAALPSGLRIRVGEGHVAVLDLSDPDPAVVVVPHPQDCTAGRDSRADDQRRERRPDPGARAGEEAPALRIRLRRARPHRGANDEEAECRDREQRDHEPHRSTDGVLELGGAGRGEPLDCLSRHPGRSVQADEGVIEERAGDEVTGDECHDERGDPGGTGAAEHDSTLPGAMRLGIIRFPEWAPPKSSSPASKS